MGRAGGHRGLIPHLELASPRPLTMLQHGPTVEPCEANLYGTLACAEYYSYWTQIQKLQGSGGKICPEHKVMCCLLDLLCLLEKRQVRITYNTTLPYLHPALIMGTSGSHLSFCPYRVHISIYPIVSYSEPGMWEQR